MSTIKTKVMAAVMAAAFAVRAADGVWTAGGGSWTNPANWADGVLPDAGGAAAFAGAGGTVTVPSGYPFTLSALYANTNGTAWSWTLSGETNTLVAPALVRNDADNLFFSMSLVGSAGFQKTGGGTLKLQAASPLLSGSVQVLGGRLLIGADSFLGQVPASYQADAVVLDNGSLGNDDATVTLAATRGVTLGSNGGYLFGRNGNQMVMASPITGGGNLNVILQSGFVRLDNTNNDYTGDTVVGSTGPGVFTPAPSAKLILGDNEVIPDGAGAGGLVIDGAWKGVLDLNGKTETVNSLTGFGSAVIANGAATEGLLRAGSDDTDTAFSGSLQAGVTLDKIGAGTLAYSNTAASAGLLRVAAGSVSAASGGALDQTAVMLDGGSLKTPVTAAGQRFSGPLLLARDAVLDRTGATAAFVWSGPLLPTNAAGTPVLAVSGGIGPFTVGSTNRSAVFAIDASSASGVIFTNRVWLETLPMSSSWSIAAGSDVAIGTPGLLGTGPLTVSDYSVRLVAADSLGSGGETVTVQGSGNAVWFDATGEAEGRLTDAPPYAFTAANDVVLSGTGTKAGFDGAGTVTYAGTISGSGSLVKNGSGDAVLGAANTFAGSIQINAGRLLVSDDNQLGDSANTVTVSGGYLGNAGGAAVALSRDVAVSAGGFDVSSGTFTLNGVVSGTGVKRGAGTLALGGALANGAFDLEVAAGVAVLGKSGAQAVRHVLGVATGAVVRLAGNGGDQIGGNAALTGGTLDLNGLSEAVGTLVSTSLASTVANQGAAAALTVGASNVVSVYYGSLAGAALTLAKTGTNLFTLAGAAGTQRAGAIHAQGGFLSLGAGVRYLRMRPGATRAGAAPAIGELQLTLRGAPLPWPTGTATTASSSVGSNTSWMVYDNNALSYWQANAAPAWITVDAKTAQLCDGYRWYTSNANINNDPLNWTIEISADGVNWFTVDSRENQTVTTARGALGAAYAFSGAWPCDAAGDATTLNVYAGATLRLMLPDEAVGVLTGAGALALTEGSSLYVGDATGFSGTVSGRGRLLLGGDTGLKVPSAASIVRAVNAGAVPATVTVGGAGEPLFAAALADGASTLGLAKVGTGTLTVIDSGSAYSGDTRVEQGTLKVQAPMWRFRYIRFNPTMTLNGNVPNSGYVLAIAELQLLSNGVVVAYPPGTTASTPYANHSSGGAANAINGSITDRWLSSAIPNPLTIDTQTGVVFNGYRWFTSGVNSADRNRAPVIWTMEGSDDGVAWMTLCGETGVAIPPFVSGTGQSAGDFSARPARFNLPIEFYGETNSAALKLAAVTARYLRFTVTDTRLNAADFANTGFQLSEIQLMRNGAPLLYPAGTVATAPGDGYNDYGGRYFPPQMAVDNALPVPGTDTNRWYSIAMVNPMTVDMGQPVTFDGYRWYTGPNGTGRDPLGWRLEVSNNATNWYAVDVRTNQTVTLARNALAGTWSLDIPAGLSAADAIPDGSRTYVAADATLHIVAGSETVGPLAGAGSVVLAASTLGINGFEDAVFAGGVAGAGSINKSGAGAQSFTGALAFSGEIVVEDGVLDLTGATLTGVTNIVLRGGLLTGSASVTGNLTIVCQGGSYNGNLDVSGALSVAGNMTLALPNGTALPYTQRLFAFASADASTRAALAAAVTTGVPHGFRASVHVGASEARWAVAAPGTVLMLR